MTAKEKLDKAFEILDKNSISISDYPENGKVCGYELETWTNGGVDMLIFLDFRRNGSPKSINDFVRNFKEHIEYFDIDDEIDLYRQDELYRNTFSITESVKDFEDYINTLKDILTELETLVD